MIKEEFNVEKMLSSREEKVKRKSKRVVKGLKTVSVKKLTKKEKQIIELANTIVLPDHYSTVWTDEDLFDLCNWLLLQKVVAVDTETMGVNPFKDEIVGVSFYAPHRGWYIPLKHIEHTDESREGIVGVDFVRCLPKDLVSSKLKPLLEDKNKKFIFHNAKFDLHIFHNWLKIDVFPYFDTMIASALLNENISKSLKELAKYYLKIPADKFQELFGKVTFDKIPIRLNSATRTGNLATYYATKDTEMTFKLYEFFSEVLERPNIKKIKSLFYDLEMPFLNIVVEAELRGVRVDTEYLETVVAKQLHSELEELRQKIWAFTGEINLKSPAQLSEVLYNKLKLPRVNKKKPNSTDKKTLETLKKEHEVIPLILDFRSKAKLVDAFADKLPKAVIDGRIHTNFNQVGARTGRMSCSNPNLQQIPAKVGNLIRNAFIADEGRLLVSIDYSQQEVRVLAHVSQDKVLMDIYKNGKDVHSMTSVGMWNRKHPNEQVTYDDFEYRRGMTELFQDADGNIDKSKLTDEHYIQKLFLENKINSTDVKTLFKDAELGIKYEKIRKEAKVVNFGIIYGMSAIGLASKLEISEDEAKIYIDGYFDAYPGVKKWIAEKHKEILREKYTTTLLGRKRRVYNEINSGKPWLISKGLRRGVNSIIQGSSADMTKLASIKLQRKLKELDAYIVLWVHDEILFDVPESIGMDNLKRISEIMCNALPLDCGLKSDIEVGKKWGQKMSDDDIRHLLEDDDGDDEED